MEKENIKHVFFDLDHTLWDFETNSALAFQKIFGEHRLNIQLDDFLTVYKPLNFQYWKLYREERVTKAELRYKRLKDTFDALDKEVTDDLIDQLAIDYIENLPKFNHLIQGTEEILNYLKSKYQLHIITNGFQEVQSRKMQSTNIDHYFDQIITSETVGVKKPNPKVFEYALTASGAQNYESIMIGDSLEADIQGAIDVGMKAIYCDFESEEPGNSENYIAVNSLVDIKQYL